MRRTKMLHILEMLIVCGVGLTLILSPGRSWRLATKILAIALLAGGVIALLYFMILRKRGNAAAGPGAGIRFRISFFTSSRLISLSISWRPPG